MKRLLLAIAILAVGCTVDQLTTPDAVDTPEGTTVGVSSGESSTPTYAGNPTECEIVRLKQSSIESETDCEKGVRFYVEADPTTGSGWFNIHLGGLNNGKVLGPNDLNTWSDWYDLKAGDYTYTVAAETKVDGKVVQCDRHNFTFTIEECEDGCVPDPEPQCECGEPTYNDVTCKWTCPKCECIPEPKPECECGEPKYNRKTCKWKCPDCPECVVPPGDNFCLSSPHTTVPTLPGPPSAECAFFGLSSVVNGAPVGYVTKCALCYEFTHGPWTLPQCIINNKDVSHSTPCYCPPE